MIALGPKPRRRDWAGATALSNAIPSSVTNSLFLTERSADVGHVVEEARAFFGRRLPWKIVATPETAEMAARAATSVSMRAGPSEPGLAIEAIPAAPPPPAGLTIVEAENADEFRAFRKAGGIGFRIPRWILRVSMPSLPPRPAIPGAGVRFFVGYVAGRPVTTSALFVSDRIAGIFFVATIPSARRRGFGAAMTWAALEAARRAGAETGFLQASAMGRPLYEQMGFRWVTDYAQWTGGISGLSTFGAVLRLFAYGLSRWS